MKANTEKGRVRISWRVFVIVAILHAISSVLLGGLLFTTGMAAFTENVSSKLALLQSVGWLWIPPLMIALHNPTGSLGIHGLLLITLVWSSVVGFAFGFIIPWLTGWKRDGRQSSVEHGPYDY